jgi:hypothetical protein
LDSNERESKQSGRSKLTSIADECSPDTSPILSDFQTSGDAADQIMKTRSTAPENTYHPLTSSAEAFPVRTSAMPESGQESTENAAACGPSMRESFANYDPATSSWRTSQLCLDGAWSEFSETWPRAGMTQSGKAYELPMLAPHTDENESGSLPTPKATEHEGGYSTHGGADSLGRMATKGTWPTPTAVHMWPTPQVHDATGGRGKNNLFADGHYYPHDLADAVKSPLWPTPTADDANNATRESGAFQSLTREIVSNETRNGQLNPTWVEWLMGYPLGWTALEDSATPSSRKSRNGSGKGLCNARRKDGKT